MIFETRKAFFTYMAVCIMCLFCGILLVISSIMNYKDDTIITSNYEYVETEDREQLKSLISETEQRKENAHQLAESARNLGYDEEHKIILIAKEEWRVANECNNDYTARYNELGPDFKAKAQEYPAATEIWFYLKNLGYNDYVCAGIMGNLMAEVGGHTLDIQYWLTSSGGYYGMCQWSPGYAEVHGADLFGQCEFLKNTIQYEMDTYGNKYAPGFNYEQFLNLTDEKEVALAFAKCYERCNSAYYKVRQDNATVAYQYFTT